jgi:dihydroflavonol-4-reductase
MKTLVTGATGFLGSHLVAELCRRGDPNQVRVFSQTRSERLARAGVEVVTGSVLSREDLVRALDGVDRIYHLAGFVSRKASDGPRMFAVHVDGTRLLCEAARAAKIKRIVLASTSGTIAVSEREDEMPDEESPAPVDLIGRWPYYASKLYQEEAARRACGSEVELVTVNPSLLLGPGDERLSSTRDVLSFLAQDIPLVPPGGLSFVDARDVAAALPAAMEQGRAGERYLMGAYNWSFAEYFGRLERMTKVPAPRLKAPKGRWTVLATRAQAALFRQIGRAPKVEPEAVEMASHFWYFDSAKARAELGFAPRDAAETLFDTVTYIRRTFLGAAPLKGDAADAALQI